MKKIHFLLGIHNNQPVGNFEHLFQKAYSTCYRPFISLLEKHPLIKISLHFSGSLLEWFASEKPSFLERINELVTRGQAEIISGGFYEPVFSMLREQDALGQINMTNAFISDTFTTTPRGAWLAERVWDPVMPRLLAKAQLSYTLLDSTHFLSTGLNPEQIRGYFVTEREGSTVAVFPIDMKLRYMIPFEPPSKTIDYLRYLASDIEDVAICYGDDGEKFGMWPGTHDWVYENGWLDAFFTALEKNRDMIHLATFSEYLDQVQPQGNIYLPTLSYEEMMQWALPAEAVARFEDMVENLENLELHEKYRPFLKGGYWNNFLVKYPESNHMHKKMLLVSERISTWQSTSSKADQSLVAAARKELYQGQCNCAYWHGLFGGIYLNYLRHAVYEHLIKAEKIIDSAQHGDSDWIDYRVFDFTRRHTQDILVSGKNLNACFSLNDGGSMFELDIKERAFNLTNTLTRKMEGYHRRLKLKNGNKILNETTGQPVSIHNINSFKEEGLQEYLSYDWYQRYSFIDHFLGSETTPDNFALSQYPEIGNFVNTPYILEHIEKNDGRSEVTFTLYRDGFVLQDDHQLPIRITKNFCVQDARKLLTAAYTLTNNSSRDVNLWFGIEFNLSLLSDNDPLHHYQIAGQQLPLNHRGDFHSMKEFAVKDAGRGINLAFGMSPAQDIGMFPLVTVSQSEAGLEKTYQGSTILLHRKLVLPRRQSAQQTITLTIAPYKVNQHKP